MNASTHPAAGTGQFGVTRRQLLELADCPRCRGDPAGMESTSDYWNLVYFLRTQRPSAHALLSQPPRSGAATRPGYYEVRQPAYHQFRGYVTRLGRPGCKLTFELLDPTPSDFTARTTS